MIFFFFFTEFETNSFVTATAEKCDGFETVSNGFETVNSDRWTRHSCDKTAVQETLGKRHVGVIYFATAWRVIRGGSRTVVIRKKKQKQAPSTDAELAAVLPAVDKGTNE